MRLISPIPWAAIAIAIAAQPTTVPAAQGPMRALAGREDTSLEYTVTVQRIGTGKGAVTSSPGGIECGEDCSEKYVDKTRLTLIATPEPGSAFDHWSGGSCAGTGPCEKTINSSRLIKAVFVAVGERTLTVSKAGAGTGMVSSNTGGIACGATCSAEIGASSKITLAAEPAAGSVFAGWSGACSGTAPKCRLLMNEARSVTATFEKAPQPPSEVFVSSAAWVRGKTAPLRISCNGPSPCQGALKLLLKIRNAEGKPKGLVVGASPFSLAAGTVRTLAIKLSSRAMRVLESTGRLRLRIIGASESHPLLLGLRRR